MLPEKTNKTQGRKMIKLDFFPKFIDNAMIKKTNFGAIISILMVTTAAALCLSEANNKHETPLHTAASEMKLEVVKILCTHGADVNVRTSKGATPLHYAACKPCVEIIDVFYKNGADLSAKDNGGMQPYHWAKSMNRTEIQRFLIDHGAKVRDY